MTETTKTANRQFLDTLGLVVYDIDNAQSTLGSVVEILESMIIHGARTPA